MKTKILFFIIITILSLAIYSQSNDSTCHPPRNPSSPGGDNTDENFSFSEGTFKTSGINNTLILVSGFYKEADSLLNGIFFDMPEIARNLLKISPVLVIPSGGFYGKENDTLLKIVLREYVSSGGNIVIFTQQYGAHTDNLGLLSGDEQGKNIGWREGQSCTFNSIFWEYAHPIISSQTSHAISMAVDGYTDTWPSTATVVLRHRLSGRPVLLYYPYGEGTVFLASGMYSDWASAHSQMTDAERKIVRDLLSFAQAPELPIQMIEYSSGTNSVIDLQAKLVNPGETPAVKAIIKVTTPDKDRVLFESTQDIAVNPGGEAIIPISFTLPEIRTNELGIFHTLYQLLDADGEPLQWENESLTARFAVYKTGIPYQPPKDCSLWVTAKKDFFYWRPITDRPTFPVQNVRFSGRNEDMPLPELIGVTSCGRPYLRNSTLTWPENLQISY